MATQPKTPPEPDGDSPAESEQPGTSALLVGEYLDETPRTYLWPDGPQSAEKGDVCALPPDWPNDGRWRVAKLIITRLRDNHKDQREVTSKRQSEARAEIHRLANEQGAAAPGKA